MSKLIHGVGYALYPPWINCTHHGVRKGYFVCLHLLIRGKDGLYAPFKGEEIAVTIAPTESMLGVVRCKRTIEHDSWNHKVMCEECLKILGMLPREVAPARLLIDNESGEPVK